jgi:hypothetical protein
MDPAPKWEETSVGMVLLSVFVFLLGVKKPWFWVLNIRIKEPQVP